jgi:hypothetical protein
MKSDAINLASQMANHPELASLIMSRNIAVSSIATCDIIDKSFGQVSNSFADLISQMFLFDNTLPFTSSPFKPLTGVTFPAAMNVGAADIAVPMRWFSNSSANPLVLPIPIAALNGTIRFQNNTVSGDIAVDVFYLDYYGNVITAFTRNTVVTPTGGANSVAEFAIWSASRAVQGNIPAATNVMDLSTVQSTAYYKVIQAAIITNLAAVTPADLATTVIYSVLSVYPFPGIYNPATIVMVFRNLATAAQSDVTVTPLYCSPDGIKNIINLMLSKLS